MFELPRILSNFFFFLIMSFESFTAHADSFLVMEAAGDLELLFLRERLLENRLS